MLYRKPYKCTQCGTEWEDIWDCLCDDRCPNCDTVMSVDNTLCEELCTGCEEHGDTCPYRPDGLDEFMCPNDHPEKEKEEKCPECDRVLKNFMHNCPNSSDMPEIYGCPMCDDNCPFCR